MYREINTQKEKYRFRGILIAIAIMILFWALQALTAFMLQVGNLFYEGLTGGQTEGGFDNSGQAAWLQIWTSLLSTLLTIVTFRMCDFFSMKMFKFRGLERSHLVLLAVLLITFSQGMSILTEFTALPDLVQETLDLMLESPFGALAIAIVGPIGEEVVFRGSVISQLRKTGWGTKGAVIISALIFGLVHLNPNQIFFAAILGLLLGWVYVRTDSLVPCIFMHMLNNCLSVLMYTIMDNPTASTSEQIGTIPAVLLMFACLAMAFGTILALRPRLKKMSN